MVIRIFLSLIKTLQIKEYQKMCSSLNYCIGLVERLKTLNNNLKIQIGQNMNTIFTNIFYFKFYTIDIHWWNNTF